MNLKNSCLKLLRLYGEAVRLREYAGQKGVSDGLSKAFLLAHEQAVIEFMRLEETILDEVRSEQKRDRRDQGKDSSE